MDAHDLGILSYRDAWDIQERAHADVLAGGASRVFTVEHPPVVTFGRRPGQEKNVLAGVDQLTARGVELVPSDRGGDVTFHGPGQLVCYPIIRLADYRLTVSGYVHLLENVIVDTLAEFGIATCADPAAVGVWTAATDRPAKVCAIGVRIRRGVTMHGLALNVTTDLSFFDLIVPCGLAGRAVTSMKKQLGDQCPAMTDVKAAVVRLLGERLRAHRDYAGRHLHGSNGGQCMAPQDESNMAGHVRPSSENPSAERDVRAWDRAGGNV